MFPLGSCSELNGPCSLLILPRAFRPRPPLCARPGHAERQSGAHTIDWARENAHRVRVIMFVYRHQIISNSSAPASGQQVNNGRGRGQAGPCAPYPVLTSSAIVQPHSGEGRKRKHGPERAYATGPFTHLLTCAATMVQ